MSGIRYTKKDVEYYLDNCHTKTNRELAQDLKRKTKSIKSMCRHLGLRKPKKELTKKQKENLLNTKFPKYASKEEKFVVDNYFKFNNRELCKKTGLCMMSITNVAKKFGLPLKKEAKLKQETIDFIKENYLTMPLEQLIKATGKTKNSIQLIAERNGILKVIGWSDKEENYLRTNWNKLPFLELCKKLKRTKKAVKHHLTSLGFKFDKRVTWIEREIEMFLTESKLNFQAQGKIGKFKPDFIVGNLVIETNGTYWHADKRVYSKKDLTERQKQAVAKDKRKFKYLKNLGYEVLVIWEKDINENFELIKKKITASIKKSIKIGESPV